MFIGSNDMNTCKEYSELCGNITVVTNSTSGSAYSSDVNLSSQTQVRPLIYPSELQRLNRPGDIGHSIIVTFGNYPLKTYFTPCFKVPLYKTGKMDTSELNERFFNENEIFYSVKSRNEIILGATGSQPSNEIDKKDNQTEVKQQQEEKSQIDEVKQEETTSQINDESKLIELWQNFKQHNKNATLEDFYESMVNRNKVDKKDGD